MALHPSQALAVLFGDHSCLDLAIADLENKNSLCDVGEGGILSGDAAVLLLLQ
jgi:hypothetical protein